MGDQGRRVPQLGQVAARLRKRPTGGDSDLRATGPGGVIGCKADSSLRLLADREHVADLAVEGLADGLDVSVSLRHYVLADDADGVRAYLRRQADETASSDTAKWDPEDRILFYVTKTAYACPPDGAATRGDASVDLLLTGSSTSCDGPEHAYIVTIRGLSQAPTELDITGDGEPKTAPVE